MSVRHKTKQNSCTRKNSFSLDLIFLRTNSVKLVKIVGYEIIQQSSFIGGPPGPSLNDPRGQQKEL